MSQGTDAQHSAREVLDAETAAARAKLAELRRDVALVQEQLGSLDVARVVQVNEQLVLAAMRADEIAKEAVADLHRLQRMADQHNGHLRDANEQLVLKGIQAHELEARSEAAHRRQVAFLATVAHELRNPLAPIRTAANLLSRAEKEPATLERLRGIIERQVAHMARLIEDLLDAARGDVGQFRLDLAEIDLLAVIEQALEAARPLAEAREHTLQVHVPPGPVMVHADPTRLAQVFCNLLDNACKYTPKGGEITLTVLAGAEAVTIGVADNGIGISAPALPHVFDMFVQETRAHQLDKAGLGIGLAVVRSLVTAHGGNIVAHSAGEQQGSEFVVTLPLRQATAA